MTVIGAATGGGFGALFFVISAAPWAPVFGFLYLASLLALLRRWSTLSFRLAAVLLSPLSMLIYFVAGVDLLDFDAGFLTHAILSSLIAAFLVRRPYEALVEPPS